MDADFRDLVSARWTPLLRTAYLLTGDPARAERLLQRAFVRAYRHWRTVRWNGDPEEYLLETLIRMVLRRRWLSGWRAPALSVSSVLPRALRGARPHDMPPSGSAPGGSAAGAAGAAGAASDGGDPGEGVADSAGDSAAGAADRLWRALVELPPRTRVVLVLRYHEGLGAPEIAALLGCSPEAADREDRYGLDLLDPAGAADREAAGALASGHPGDPPARAPGKGGRGAAGPDPPQLGTGADMITGPGGGDELAGGAGFLRVGRRSPRRRGERR